MYTNKMIFISELIQVNERNSWREQKNNDDKTEVIFRKINIPGLKKLSNHRYFYKMLPHIDCHVSVKRKSGNSFNVTSVLI